MKTHFSILLLLSLVLAPFSFTAQCPGGQVMVNVDVATDDWGYESFWDLTPSGAGCGNGVLFSFGNTTQINCSGAGAQIATGGNGYANNVTTTESLGCLTINDCFDINFVDDWGDGGSTFTVNIMGISQGPFVGSGTGNTFNFCVTVPSVNDVDMTTSSNEYSKIPLSQIGNIVNDGIITSVGAGNVTGAYMNVTVLLGVTSVYSANSTPQNLNAGSSAMFSVTGYTPTAVGIYTILYTSDITETDEILTNNETSYSIEITDSVYARDNGINDIGGLGIGGNLEGNLGNIFAINNAVKISSISALIDNSQTDITGNTFQMEVFSVNGTGTPLNSIATSSSATISGTNQWYTLNITPPLLLAAGDYLVSIKQDTSYQQQIAASTSIFTSGSSWVRWTNQPWTLAETFGTNATFMIRANFNEFASYSELEETALAVYPNPAQNELNISDLDPETKIEIYSNSGQKILSVTSSENPTRVDIKDFENGIYIVKTVGKEKVGIGKFIKN